MKIVLCLIMFVVLGSILTINAYAVQVDNNCLINPIHILQVHIALGCIESRLDALENAPIPSASGEANTASNLGSVGQGWFSQKVGVDLQFKKILNGTGITLSSNGTRIMINSTSGGETTVCTNQGSGSQIFKDGNCNFRTILGSPDISVTQQTNTVTIDYNGTAGALRDRVLAQTFFSLVKTNIGTAYIDIYITAFDQENMNAIDCTSITDIRLTYIWDYVGVGTQQLRWVDVSDNANVLYESPTFTTDRDAVDSGWITKPAWCTGIKFIEQQGKSTTASDDPLAKGYVIRGR